MKKREIVVAKQEQRMSLPPSSVLGRSCKGVNNNTRHLINAGPISVAQRNRGSKFLSMSPLQLDAGTPAHSFQKKGQAWFVATELQSDLVVEVDELKFHLHKFPLLSRSGRLNRLVFESRDTETDRIKLTEVPGGPEAFELAARFCYGMPIDLNPCNVAALRCAAEHLEMVEELEEGNLIAKTEAFLTLVVLASWKDTLTVLLSCEKLCPWAEELQIVRRCCESLAWKACTNNWPMISSKRTMVSQDVRTSALKQVPQDWWLEDISMLCIDHFTKVMQAVKAKGMKAELVGAAVTCYALKWIPTLSGDMKDVNARLVVESMVGLLPSQRNSVSCCFLLQMLRIAMMQNASSSCRMELEKRIGMQLEQASLGDLLIPSYSVSETIYDVELVQRLLEHFLVHDDETSSEQSPTETPSSVEKAKQSFENKSFRSEKVGRKARVAKLLDGYLAEIAHDPHLTVSKFQALAEALPVYSRACHDGLYRAIDMYLKAHPTATEQERKRLCKIMDCQRLSSEARLHASQNERLPLRTVVQVLFSEHVKFKSIYGCGSFGGTQVTPTYSEGSWENASQELRALRKDVEKIKEQFLELRTGYSYIKQDLQKILRSGKRSPSSTSSSWGCGLKRLGSIASPRFFHRDGPSSTPDIFRSRRWR